MGIQEAISEQLTLTVKRVLFYSETPSFAVFAGVYERHGESVEVRVRTNAMPFEPMPRHIYELTGRAEDHPNYGDQFVAEQVRQIRAGGHLIRFFLESFKGVGKSTSSALWDEYGAELASILDDEDIEKLTKIPRISEELAWLIVHAWHDDKSEVETYKWLAEHGFEAQVNNSGVPVKSADKEKRLLKVAKKVWSYYKQDTVKILEDDPYRLWAFASWRECELVADSLGIARADPRRLVCAVEEALYSYYHQGHTVVSPRQVEITLIKLIGNDLVVNALFEANNVDSNKPPRIYVKSWGDWQLPGPRIMEAEIAHTVKRLLNGESSGQQSMYAPVSSKVDLEEYRLPGGYPLANEQKHAVQLIMNNSVACISGGAGVGKTSLLRAVFDAFVSQGVPVYQLAVAGKAAQRMSAATGHDATSIAAFLARIRLEQLTTCPAIIIDEASMVCVPLMYQVIRKFADLPFRLVLLGDPGQIAPIGPGLVFHPLLDSKTVPSKELVEIHRQKAETGIPVISQKIRKGEWPDLPEYQGLGAGVQFLHADSKEDIKIACERLYSDFGGPESKASTVVLTLTRELMTQLNVDLHSTYFYDVESVPGAEEFGLGDPVLYKKNCLNLGLVNGSVGYITRVYSDPKKVADDDGAERLIVCEVKFDVEGVVALTLEDIKPAPSERLMQHGYALTTHQSQGSEYKRVIIPVHKHGKLLDRSMLYTALTRASMQAVFVGDEQAAKEAVAELTFAERRQTGLIV